ncbi:MAG TPA: hypothetical protein VII87_05715, partial [Solirubrobacteraceae bacterium]
MRRPRLVSRVTAGTLIALAVALLGAVPAAATGRHARRHVAARPFRPRIGTAMGLLPRLGSTEIASGTNIPVVYHGGQVMRNVTVHTIFWAPAGYRFTGSPGGGVPGYED